MTEQILEDGLPVADDGTLKQIRSLADLELGERVLLDGRCFSYRSLAGMFVLGTVEELIEGAAKVRVSDTVATWIHRPSIIRKAQI